MIGSVDSSSSYSILTKTIQIYFLNWRLTWQHLAYLSGIAVGKCLPNALVAHLVL